MSNRDHYIKDLIWLRLGNKALRAFPSSPRQKEILAQQKAREAEIDAALAAHTQENPK